MSIGEFLKSHYDENTEIFIEVGGTANITGYYSTVKDITFIESAQKTFCAFRGTCIANFSPALVIVDTARIYSFQIPDIPRHRES